LKHTAYPVNKRCIKAGSLLVPLNSRKWACLGIRAPAQIRKRVVFNPYFPFTSVSFISCLPQKASFSLVAQNSGEKDFYFATT
jgi:hypothetical protein